MAKIFDWLKPTGNVSTNAFDVSKRTTFSMPCANLECPLIRVASPKYKGEISLNNSVINTRPMINQPFNRGQFVLDFYQVPFKQIMSRFDEFYTQLQEGFSSSDNLDNNPQLPHVDLWTLVSMMAYDYMSCMFDNHGYIIEAGIYRFTWSTEMIPSSTIASQLILGVDVHGIPRCYGMFRLLDLMGYGNFYMAFKEFATLYARWTVNPTLDYRPVARKLLRDFQKFIFDKFIDGDGISQDYYDAVDEFFESETTLTDPYQICIQLNDANLNNFNVADGPGPRLCPNILAFYAYQKVFADIYRNSFYDHSNRFAFNADDICNNDSGSSFVELLSWLNGSFPHGSELWFKHIEVFELRYRQFKKDMFTSLLPNSQFGEVSTVNVGDSVFNLRVVNAPGDSSNNGQALGVNIRNSDNFVRVGGSGPTGYTNVADFKSNNLTFSVLMQRRAEALQKYKERYLRAGNRMRDQYISSFGKVPYYLEDKYVRYLGSIDSRLSVQGVPATSDTGDYTVGERGSYGYAGINGKINFTCDDWSFIVGIFYYLPEVDYQSFGIEACHKFSEFQDFIVPEFENVGLEPVYRTTLSALATQVSGIPAPVGGERVIGYGPSYMYFKTDVDKVHGEFGSTNELNGVFHNWVTTRGNVSMSELSDYYVRPDYLNSVMQQGYTGGQDTDPFLCVLDFDFKNIVPLSVVGLPIWD